MTELDKAALTQALATTEPIINWHGTHFSYQHQPSDNVTCWRLGEAARSAKPGGDLIDHGLSLLQQLQKQGFGVFSLSAKTQPATTEPKAAPVAWVDVAPGDCAQLGDRIFSGGKVWQTIDEECGLVGREITDAWWPVQRRAK